MSQKYLDLAGLTAYDGKIKEWIKSGVVDIEDEAIMDLFVTSPYKMVDLGLPSGLKWADRNVGASSPEDYGLYFQWGDTVGYTSEQVGVDKVFNWGDYFDTTDNGSTFNKYNTGGGLKVLESIDDIATVHMGSQYRMPTANELLELLEYTTKAFIDLGGNEYSQEQAQNGAIESGKFKGVRFTGSNGNSIFIPAAGWGDEDGLDAVGFSACLWSSDLAFSPKSSWCLRAYLDGDASGTSWNRYYGYSIRGVQA
jgi:hypothetical protein